MTLSRTALLNYSVNKYFPKLNSLVSSPYSYRNAIDCIASPLPLNSGIVPPNHKEMIFRNEAFWEIELIEVMRE